MNAVAARAHAADAWAPAPGVAWCDHGGVTTVLSLDSGRYFTLDEDSGRIWKLVCDGMPLDAIVETLATCATLTATSIRDDVLELSADLRRRGLIVPARPAGTPALLEGATPTEAHQTSDSAGAASTGTGQPPPPVPATVNERHTPGVPSVLACIVRLSFVTALLRVTKLRSTARLLARTPLRAAARRLPDAWLQRLARNVRIAASLCPWRTACLEESVTLWWTLRAAGGEAQIRIGVYPYPFAAHAWVEHFGEPVNESREDLMAYRVLPRLDLTAS